MIHDGIDALIETTSRSLPCALCSQNVVEGPRELYRKRRDSSPSLELSVSKIDIFCQDTQSLGNTRGNQMLWRRDPTLEVVQSRQKW